MQILIPVFLFFLRKRKTELFTVSPFFALLKLLQIYPEIVVPISIVIKILASSDNLSTWRWLSETFTPLKRWKYLENFFARYLQFCLKSFWTLKSSWVCLLLILGTYLYWYLFYSSNDSVFVCGGLIPWGIFLQS